MTAVYFGDGTPAALTLGDGTAVFGVGEQPADPLGPVTFTTEGTFQPSIELSAGSTATVEWQTADGTLLTTGTDPTITGQATVRMRVVSPDGYDRHSHVRTVNLGFNHTDDAGRYNIGAGYDKAATSVTGVAGLGALTGMRRFCAASTLLTGHLDLSGCTALEYVEVYQSRVTSCTLTGCDSLIRLCLEQCRVTTLDLNPVRRTLRDHRSADQGQIGGLTFAPLDGPMELLYHYCVRAQAVHGLIPLGLLPAIEEYWCWETGQTAMSSGAVSPVIRSLPLQGNTYDQAAVDLIISSVRDVTTQDWGVIDLTDSAAPSGAVAADIAWLDSRAWNIITT